MGMTISPGSRRVEGREGRCELETFPRAPIRVQSPRRHGEPGWLALGRALWLRQGSCWALELGFQQPGLGQSLPQPRQREDYGVSRALGQRGSPPA